MSKPGQFVIIFVIFVAVLLCLVPNALGGVTFSKQSFAGKASDIHADLNNDGREDFVFGNGNAGGFSVQLSAGSTAYASPTSYALPAGAVAITFAVGDFNSDGHPDLAVFATDGNMYEFLNNGNGTFHEQAAFALGSEVNSATAGDFNHDGHIDLAFMITTNLHIWFGNGNNGFTVGPTTATTNTDYLIVGDFDGDGNADIAIGDNNTYNKLEVRYGDGTGHFPVATFIMRSDHSEFSAADVNGDGKMDILASTFYPTSLNHIPVYYGNASRTWTETDIPISKCASNSAVPTAADMNGDGTNDLVVPESDCGVDGTGTRYIGVLTRNSSGTYNPDQIVYTAPGTNLVLENMNVVRGDQNTKPDISLAQCTAVPCVSAYNLTVLRNTTTGNFPTCTPPNAFEGIHVCSPLAGSTVTSPVKFRVGAAGQTPMRKVEVWVDGKKLVEQLDGFSHYTFMDKTEPLAAGSHQVTIYAAGWDNWLEKTSFTLKVQ